MTRVTEKQGLFLKSYNLLINNRLVVWFESECDLVINHLPHFFAGSEFDGWSLGDDNRFVWDTRIATDLLLPFHDFEHTKIAEFKAISFG